MSTNGHLRAPWTPEQIEGLNRWQSTAHVHGFTCGNNRSDEAHRRYAADNGQHDWGLLVAAEDGWHCPVCGYTQDWAHPFMVAEPPPNPLAYLFDRRAR